MVRQGFTEDANPFDEAPSFLEPRTDGKHRRDELPDDWFDFDPRQFDASLDELSEAGETDAADARDAATEQTYSVGKRVAQADGYIKRRERVKVTKTVVGVVVALLVVAGLAFGFASGAFASLFKSNPEPQLVSSSASMSSIVEVTADAEGYDEQASSIVYHLVGTASGDSAVLVDRYGILPATSGDSGASGTTDGDVFKVTFDDLPEGSYTLSWSSSFLSDGSFLRAPADLSFKTSRGTITLSTAFEKVNAASASADEVRAAYAALVTWLAATTGEVADSRDAIVDVARRNAEKVPAVIAAGGLDGSDKKEESKDESADDQEEDQEQAVDQADDSDYDVVVPDYNDGGNSGNGDSGGNIEPEPTPAPEPMPESEPAPEPTPEPVPEPTSDTAI